jgi:hypothetical protein
MAECLFDDATGGSKVVALAPIHHSICSHAMTWQGLRFATCEWIDLRLRGLLA